MADITGNFGVNTHGYTNEISKKSSAPAQSSAHEEEVKKPEINLDKDPAAISGKSLIKTANVGKKADGYQMDPEKIKADVLEFMALGDITDSVSKDYAKALVEEQGYDPVAADEKAAMFRECLWSCRNA